MAQHSHFSNAAHYLIYDTHDFELARGVRAFSNRFGILYRMTKLLDEAIHRLRKLPDRMQDTAARVLLTQLEEEPEPGDAEAIAEGRREVERGDFVTLDELRHEMGPDNR